MDLSYLNSTEDFKGSYMYNVEIADTLVSLIKSF